MFEYLRLDLFCLVWRPSLSVFCLSCVVGEGADYDCVVAVECCVLNFFECLGKSECLLKTDVEFAVVYAGNGVVQIHGSSPFQVAVVEDE